MLTTAPGFDDAQLPGWLREASAQDLESLDFGAIGFDATGDVRRYNMLESHAAGLSPDGVLGLHLFELVAPCMNNFMVAQRFEDAREQGVPLDATIDYVLTLRMRPVKVKLRLVAVPDLPLRYVLVQRRLP